MARLLVCDSRGFITVDVETNGPVLSAALENAQAEPVVRCAVLMALSALAEGGAWPIAALQTLAQFMAGMKDEVVNADML